MGRLIDADEAIRISKEDKFMWVYDLTDLEEFLAGVPTVDPIQTAGGCYCRDCKFAGKSVWYPKNIYCQITRNYKYLNDFCSDGQKEDIK